MNEMSEACELPPRPRVQALLEPQTVFGTRRIDGQQEAAAPQTRPTTHHPIHREGPSEPLWGGGELTRWKLLKALPQFKTKKQLCSQGAPTPRGRPRPY